MFTVLVISLTPCDIRCSCDHDNVTASQQIHRGDSGDYSDCQHMSAPNIVTCHIIRCQPPGVLVSTVSVQARDSAPATAWLPPPVARPLQSSEASLGLVSITHWTVIISGHPSHPLVTSPMMSPCSLVTNYSNYSNM